MIRMTGTAVGIVLDAALTIGNSGMRIMTGCASQIIEMRRTGIMRRVHEFVLLLLTPNPAVIITFDQIFIIV